MLNWLRSLNNTEDNIAVHPDELGAGFKTYADLKIEKTVYAVSYTHLTLPTKA